MNTFSALRFNLIWNYLNDTGNLIPFKLPASLSPCAKNIKIGACHPTFDPCKLAKFNFLKSKFDDLNLALYGVAIHSMMGFSPSTTTTAIVCGYLKCPSASSTTLTLLFYFSVPSALGTTH